MPTLQMLNLLLTQGFTLGKDTLSNFKIWQNKLIILKERGVIETNVKKFLEKLNCFRRYSTLKCNHVSKNSNKMAGNSKIKA